MALAKLLPGVGPIGDFKDDPCHQVLSQPGGPGEGLVCLGDLVHGSSCREAHFG